MKLKKHQRGIGLWPLLFSLAALAFIVFTALKLFPIYMQDFSVKTSVKSLEEDTGEQYVGAFSIQTALVKRFGINNVQQLGRDDISVTRDGQFYNVKVDYEVVIPYIGNISLLLHFDHKATVPVRE